MTTEVEEAVEKAVDSSPCPEPVEEQKDPATAVAAAPRQRTRGGLDDLSGPVTAEDLVEYRWPQNDPEVEGEPYMLQEQVAKYLDIVSFKRKYPDIYRRSCSYEERLFLIQQGLVSQTTCDLGLTAVKAEEILDLLMKNYPEQYQDVVKVFQRREAEHLQKMKKEHMPTYESVKITDQGRLKQMFKKAMASCQKYNSELMRERLETRKYSMDLQTYTIQVPRKHKLDFSANGDIEWKCPDPYPVAVLPGQYTTSVPFYEDSQLRRLPVGTALLPHPDTDTVLFPRSPNSIGSGSSIDELLSEPPDGDDLDLGSDDEDIRKLLEENEKVRDLDAPSASDVNSCDRCGMNDDAATFITCNRCKKTAHITCFDLFTHMLKIVRSYPWHCFDCKRCLQCSQAKNEASLLFCDICDRGFHSYCIGLTKIPDGDWCCPLCQPQITVPRVSSGASPLKPIRPRPLVDPATLPPPSGISFSGEGGEGQSQFVCDWVIPSTGRPCGAVLATKWMLRKHKDATGHKRMRTHKGEQD